VLPPLAGLAAGEADGCVASHDRVGDLSGLLGPRLRVLVSDAHPCSPSLTVVRARFLESISAFTSVALHVDDLAQRVVDLDEVGASSITTSMSL
jgi:hypothetical protein